MIGDRLEGDGTWPWLDARVEGDDIVVRGVKTSWFADKSTASGTPANNMVLRACAIPMRINSNPNLAGSPIPIVPWWSDVRVFCPETNITMTLPVIDVGPAKITGHGLDLTPTAFIATRHPLTDGIIVCDYRIIGGAKHV